MGVERAGSFGLVASQVGCHSRMSSAGVCETAVRGPPGGWVTQVLARRWACCTRLLVFSCAEVERGYVGGAYRHDDADTRRRFFFLHRLQDDSEDRRRQMMARH